MFGIYQFGEPYFGEGPASVIVSALPTLGNMQLMIGLVELYALNTMVVGSPGEIGLN